MRQRDATIDIAKGLAIIAIVLGHVLRGLHGADITDGADPVFVAWDRCLYAVHLTVFAFLSGLFVRQGVERSSAWGYGRERLTLFLYLYLLWYIIQGGVKILTAQLVNTPITLANLLEVWRPEGQLWFLPFLMIATLLAAILKPWRGTWPAQAALIVVAAVSFGGWGYDGETVGTQGIALLGFFFAGAAIGSARLLNALQKTSTETAALGAVVSAWVFLGLMLFTGAIQPTVQTPNPELIDAASGVAASVTGTAGTLALSKFLARFQPGFRWLQFLGQRSMEIFLAHIIAASGVRIILTILGMTSPELHILAGTTAGILLPLALWYVTALARFPWLFTAPTWMLRARQKEPLTPVGKTG